MSVAAGLPWALFALLSGALVDRLDRRRIMAYTDLFRFGVVGLLAVAIATDRASIWLLCLVAFALGTGETMFDNAAQAMVPALVDRPRLELANSRLASAEIVSRDFVGPPLGAVLFTAAMVVPFALDSISFAAAALLVLSVRGSFRVPRPGPPTRISHEIKEGLQWLWAHRLIRSMAIMLAVWNLVAAATQAILVLFALEILDLHGIGYGLLFTAWAAGGLLGSLVATRIIGRLGHAHALLSTVAVGALTSAGIGLSSSPWLVGVMLALEGVAIVVWNVITVSARQALVPAELFGRVNSVYRFVGWGVLPIGAALGGVLAKAVGLRAPYLLTAVVLVAMIVSARRVINPATFDAAFEDAPREPDLDTEPDLETGPEPGRAP